ncbi:MAG TPA: tripartite tricarboxylate transporter substrate binding protein [Burkholderiales bacterium]|nr:tripartite tricarboxylate transporter substrate binding protein [Burkholderiales bacterium]
MTKRAAALLFLFASAFCTAAPAQGPAAAYPGRPVRWVVPFPPGASNDIIARLIGQKLTDAWGQQFVVDNRPGAGGSIGADTVAKAAADGYTLLLSNPGPSVNNVLLRRKPLYRIEDFAPVVWIGYAPLIILAHPALPPKSARELADYARANPGKVTWGSSGPGSSLHIGLAVFQLATGASIVHVPYKGAALALNDLVGGQIHVMHTTTVTGEAQIKAGRVKVLGIADGRRSPVLPEVPTLAEQGIRGAEAIVWFGMSAPAKTPRAIVGKLNRGVNQALEAPDVKQRLDQLGLVVQGGPPEKFAAFIGSEAERLAKLIAAGAVHVE